MALTSTKSLGIGLIMASLLPLSHGANQLSAQKMFAQESSQRRATVVELVEAEPVDGQKHSPNIFSVVEFTDDDGTRRTERTNIGSYPAAHEIGEEIDIRFHLSNEEDVRVASFIGLWFESAFYLIPGFATLLGGIAMTLNGRKKQT